MPRKPSTRQMLRELMAKDECRSCGRGDKLVGLPRHEKRTGRPKHVYYCVYCLTI